jgi:hypothetical protein
MTKETVKEQAALCGINSVSNSNDEDVKDEPWYDSEDCEQCLEEAEESDIEYEHNFTWENGTWVCEHCGTPN